MGSGPPCAGDKDAAAARANYPVPPACGIYYYEVEILQKGNKGYVPCLILGFRVFLRALTDGTIFVCSGT